MRDDGRAFLCDILACHAPTGDEQELQRMLRGRAESFADEIVPDSHGNLAVVVNPDAPLRVMLAGHCDRIGFLVMQISEGGFVKVDALGGVDEATLPGARVRIRGRDGFVDGVFGKTAVHNEGADEQTRISKLDTLWIDVGAGSREEAERLVAVGDYAAFHPSVVSFPGGRIAAPGLDNALGVWTVMEVARRCADRGIAVALHCVSTVQEEVGSRGAETAAARIRPHVAIAVDTTPALDDPGHSKKQTDPWVCLGGGPSVAFGPNHNREVVRRLMKAAKAANINVQAEPSAELASNDARSLQVAGVGAATGSVGIPIRNMHTQVEVTDLSDSEAAAALLTEFVCALPEKLSFLPIDFGIEAPGRHAGNALGRDAEAERSTDRRGVTAGRTNGRRATAE